MTLYAGEMTKIVHTASVDGTELVPDDITDVTITIYSTTGDIVVAETSMLWDTVLLRWQFLWDTTDLAFGTYRAKVRVVGIDGGSVWEYKRIRLARNPV